MTDVLALLAPGAYVVGYVVACTWIVRRWQS